MQKIFDCNIHRFTEGMQKKRIRSWKDLCEQHMRRMVAAISGEPDPGPPISREDRRLLERGLTTEAMLLAQQSSFELNAEMERETPASASQDRESIDLYDTKPEEGFSHDGFDGLETQNLNDLDGAPRGQVSDMTAHWNGSALVGRLHWRARIPDARGALPMMGPRSYFEESFAETVRQNVRADDIRRERLEAYREELRLNPAFAAEEAAKALQVSKTASSLSSLAGKDRGSVYYVPTGKEVIHALRPEDMKRTIKERKELFYKLINKKTGKEQDESDTEMV